MHCADAVHDYSLPSMSEPAFGLWCKVHPSRQPPDNLDVSQMAAVAGRDQSASEAAMATPTSEPSAAAGQALRVLLAEDNPVNVKFALKLLEKAGHQVTVAGNGRQAVEFWESSPFDMVLMDVQMPEMDGLDATRTIRAKETERGGNGHTPIIAMTANAMAGDREMCTNSGMDGYVAKPVKKEALFSEVERVLAKGGVNVPRV